MRLIHEATRETIVVSAAGARTLLARGGYIDPNAPKQKPQSKRLAAKTEEQT